MIRIDRCILTVLVAALAGGSNANAAGFPIYPGAVFLPPARTVSHCGHTVNEERYTAGTTPSSTIANWYARQVPNGVRFSQMVAGAKAELVFDADGEHAVNASFNSDIQMQANPPSSFVLLTYSPPVTAAGVRLLQRASTGDRAAIAAIKAKCPTY